MAQLDQTETRPATQKRLWNEGLGQQVRERREAVGISQVRLAGLAGVHRGTVRNVELGHQAEAPTLGSILGVLGCDPETLRRDGDVFLIEPVLPVSMVRKIVGLIGSMRDHPAAIPVGSLLEDYSELVRAGARMLRGRGEPAPEALSRIRASMAQFMPPQELDELDGLAKTIFWQWAPRKPLAEHGYAPSGSRSFSAILPDQVLLRILADLHANGLSTPGFGRDMEKARALVQELLEVLDPEPTVESMRLDATPTEPDQG